MGMRMTFAFLYVRCFTAGCKPSELHSGVIRYADNLSSFIAGAHCAMCAAVMTHRCVHDRKPRRVQCDGESSELGPQVGENQPQKVQRHRAAMAGMSACICSDRITIPLANQFVIAEPLPHGRRTTGRRGQRRRCGPVV